MNGFPPTEEQQEAIDLFRTGRPVKVIAGAGTGKTTTLGMMARTCPYTGAYLAFNRAIARDASRAMPMTVTCRTVHSTAASLLGRSSRRQGALLDRLDSPRMAPWTLAKLMGVGPVAVTIEHRTKMLQPGYLAGLVMRALLRFCQSADPEPTTSHFPYVEGIDVPGPDGRRGQINNRNLASHLLPYLLDAWVDVQDPTGRLRFDHDHYLKIAQLAGLEIPGRFLLLDEAQDANPVIQAWLAVQDAQIVLVGDSQQQIYAWRGAVDALTTGPFAGAVTAYLTQSWRFGPDIAEVANLILDQLDADIRLVGAPDVRSRVDVRPSAGPPDAVLCRTNAAAVESVLSLQRMGLQPHLVGGAEDIVRFAVAAQKLQAGERTMHQDLACFESWPEVLAYVADDPQGGDLRMLVNLLEEYGIQIVLDALDGLIAEDEADVIVSTAHKAKGREWDRVRLASDFEAEVDALGQEPEWRLLYVAATRARHVLDVSRCLPLYELVAPPGDGIEEALAGLWGGA